MNRWDGRVNERIVRISPGLQVYPCSFEGSHIWSWRPSRSAQSCGGGPLPAAAGPASSSQRRQLLLDASLTLVPRLLISRWPSLRPPATELLAEAVIYETALATVVTDAAPNGIKNSDLQKRITCNLNSADQGCNGYYFHSLTYLPKS